MFFCLRFGWKCRFSRERTADKRLCRRSNPSQKDKLSYISLKHQINEAIKQGYADSEIMNSMIRATHSSFRLKSILEMKQLYMPTLLNYFVTSLWRKQYPRLMCKRNSNCCSWLCTWVYWVAREVTALKDIRRSRVWCTFCQKIVSTYFRKEFWKCQCSSGGEICV